VCLGSSCLTGNTEHNQNGVLRSMPSVQLRDFPSPMAPAVCSDEARNTQDQLGQSAPHPCLDQETDTTLTIHSSSEPTLGPFLVARLTITNHTDMPSTGRKYPNTHMPIRLMPCAKAPTGERSFAARKWLISLYSQKATPCGLVVWRGSGKVKEAQRIGNK